MEINLISKIIWANIYLIFKFLFLPKRIKYNWRSFFDLSAKMVIRKAGSIKTGKNLILEDHVKLSSSGSIEIGNRCLIKEYGSVQANGGKIKIDDNVFINSHCLFVSCESITIGAGTAFGSYVSIYDQDHVFVKTGKQPWNKTKTSPVVIGENCWIGANTIILRGTVIGNNCVIAAGSVIKGNILDSTLVVQKRNVVMTEIIDKNE